MELHEYIVVLRNDAGSSARVTGALAEPYGTHEGPHSDFLQLQPGLREYFNYIGTIVVGTGGQLEWPIAFESMLESAAPTGASAVFQSTNAAPRRADVRTVSDEVAAIKAAFGLSMSQLAEALRVKRPTIYSWIDSARAPETLRKGNRERLAKLSSLAKAWNRSSDTPPGHYLSAVVDGNFSLIQLLSADPLNPQVVLHAIEAIQIVMRRATLPQTFGERLRSIGFADRPSLTQRGKTRS